LDYDLNNQQLLHQHSEWNCLSSQEWALSKLDHLLARIEGYDVAQDTASSKGKNNAIHEQRA
jgi:hypothetical protein